MRSAAGLLVAVCLAGCFTNSRGERNLCIPGADGLCPAPELYHRYSPIQIVEPDAPVVFARSFDDLSLTFEEIAGDSTSHDVGFHDVDTGRPVSACGITCVAAWRDAKDWTVLSSVRSSSGWSAPERHGLLAVSVPAVASSGDLHLIAWLEREPAGSTSARVELRRLDPSGAVIDRATLASAVSDQFLSLTAGVDGALVTWKRQGFLVAQLLARDGTPTGPPLEAPLGNRPGTYKTWAVPSAFVDGAYRVVDDQVPADSTWAVIDPVARTIAFATVSTPDWRDAIARIYAVADGAVVVLSEGSAGIGPAIARVANDVILYQIEFPGSPVIAATGGGYQLAYSERDGSLAVEQRDADFQLVDAPTRIAESYQLDNTTCAVGRHQDLGIIALAGLVAFRRRRCAQR